MLGTEAEAVAALAALALSADPAGPPAMILFSDLLSGASSGSGTTALLAALRDVQKAVGWPKSRH